MVSVVMSRQQSVHQQPQAQSHQLATQRHPVDHRFITHPVELNNSSILSSGRPWDGDRYRNSRLCIRGRHNDVGDRFAIGGEHVLSLGSTPAPNLAVDDFVARSSCVSVSSGQFIKRVISCVTVSIHDCSMLSWPVTLPM